LTAMTYPPDDYRVEYAYHAGTRLIHRVTGQPGVEFAALEDYTADGKPGFLYQGNGTSTTFSHDPKSNLLKAIRIQAPSLDPAEDIFNKAYRYTPAGDISEVADLIQSSTRYYAYDKLHRLISEKSSTATLVHPSKVVRLQYDYEGTGPFHAPKRIESRGRIHELRYDPNGNLLDGPVLADPQRAALRTTRYTPANMPSRIDQPDSRCTEGRSGETCPQSVELFYDGENQRVIKTSSAGKTWYVGRHFQVQNGIPVRYIFAGDLRVAAMTPAGTRYYHKDHLLSTVAVTDEAGNRIESADYIPFGQVRNRSGTWSNAFRYTDQELDWETGLYNYKARLYDPALATFKAPDPYLSANRVLTRAGETGYNQNTLYGRASAEIPISRFGNYDTKQFISFFSSTPQRLNRYAYVQNSPINFVDNSGLWSERIHNKIIGLSFRNLPYNLRSEIEKGSAYADSSEFQAPTFNHMHAMRQRGESVESAKEKMQDYINDHLKEYYRLLGSGETEKAYFQLGMALHPVMDSTSPSHEGFQVWDGYVNTDSLIHWAGEQYISSERLAKTVELIARELE